MPAGQALILTTTNTISSVNKCLFAKPERETPANLHTPSQIEPRRVESRNTTDLNES